MDKELKKIIKSVDDLLTNFGISYYDYPRIAAYLLECYDDYCEAMEA